MTQPIQKPRHKVAIIGGGHIAEQNHIPALQKLSHRTEIIAICSRDKSKARLLADKFAIPFAYDNTEELFSSSRPDIIINCTANNLHYPFTMQALENGCHVLCEKPPAMRALEAREMADTAEKYGKTLAYNFQRRQTQEYQLLQKCQQEGKLGEIYHVKANFLRRRGIPGWGNFTNREIQGGGALIDLGVHVLDLAMGLMNYEKPDRIVANTYNFLGKAGGKGLLGAWDPAKFEVEDACFAYLSFPGKASIMLSASFALNTQEAKNINLEVFGTQAGAVLHPFSLHTEFAGELADVHFPFLEDENIQLKNTIAFLDACDGQVSNICSAREGAVLQEIVENIYQSAGMFGQKM
ncbi:Inositol 2-dehydrogenase/D-chiro-inositol 3-dehydrogenase [Dyadobacter sp. CECT 9275]|uniref:Inositol 2-dehydrogenase/D-chiro-inositol 3-dehydrogenase n=1 Tax=Dyadobacter helix TaxID=2822344 RepID=A0A916JEW9_9BACT|nr:Gfo/Idh/MocA family oxidoreductase [Dyadobacter sp. CECT 9275]CAG5008121.1 Inositol 2-dehydrogenase/D-chiro-inositol 3-dehydrogenase [Dyadobacter sp. CECT 9275]